MKLTKNLKISYKIFLIMLFIFVIKFLGTSAPVHPDLKETLSEGYTSALLPNQCSGVKAGIDRWGYRNDFLENRIWDVKSADIIPLSNLLIISKSINKNVGR